MLIFQDQIMLTENKKGCYLKVFITPSSSINKIVSIHGEELKIKIAAKPEGGKANRELIKFLAGILKIEGKKILISRGKTSRHKTVFFSTYKSKEVEAELRNYL